jgi:site-specific DNA recombinase
MLKLLRHGNAQGVVIHKIDRSARNLKDWADLGELIDQGIEVHFANESLDLNSRSGRLSADIQAVVAADYIRNLREEAKKGIYGRFKQGFYPLRAPLGYQDNGAGKSKTIDPVKGPLVRMMFELYTSTRFSIPTLCDEMWKRGLRNHTGSKVTRGGMGKMLNNPFYLGIVRVKKTNQTFQGNHEPLITKALFDRVQDVAEGRLNTRTQTHDFVFRRLVKCKDCGYSLIGETKKGFVYYRCHTETCPTTSIREDMIDAIVTNQLKRLEFTDDEKAYLKQRITEMKARWITDKETMLGNLRVKREQVNERLARLTDAYLENAIDRQVFDERHASLLHERKAIEDQLIDFERNGASVPDRMEHYLELAGDAYSLYQTALIEKKRRLLKRVTSNFTAHGKTLDFAYQIPFREIANRERSACGGPSKAVHRTLDGILGKLIQLLGDHPEASIEAASA